MNIKELSWKQQVEHRKVNKWGRDFNLKSRIKKAEVGCLKINEDSTASEVLDDC